MTKEELQKELTLYLNRAINGEVSCQARIGWAYLQAGEYFEAQKWLKKASSLFNRNASSLNNLGYMYEKGFYFKKDSKTALKYYIKSAKLGNGTAANNAGLIYYHGRHNPNRKPDYKKAIVYFQLAFEKNNFKSCSYLGDIYSIGKGVKRDSSKAIKYLSKGASINNAFCHFRLGWCYDTGTCVTRNYTLARQYYLKAIEYGKLAGAYSNLGRLYQYGLGVTIDLHKALEYYTEGAKLNSSLSIKQLPIVKKQLESNAPQNTNNIPDIELFDECSKD